MIVLCSLSEVELMSALPLSRFETAKLTRFFLLQSREVTVRLRVDYGVRPTGVTTADNQIPN